MDLKEVGILGADIGRHWYYSSKALAMMHLLGDKAPATILDVGAGSGFFSRHLLAHTDAKEAWCVDISYEADSDQVEGGKVIHYRRLGDNISASLVLLMDVLEHLDDDIGVLKQYGDLAPSGSRFVISVPAFQFLWSGHDDFLEHKRRYTLNQLEEVVHKAGLEVKRGAYYFGLVFPIAAILRRAQRTWFNSEEATSQLTNHSPITNLILKTVCLVELPLMRFNRMAGLSAFCLAEKT